jgi:DNA transformation protein
MSRVSTIRNLGPKVEQMFAKAGIHTAEEIHELGAEEAYRRLLKAGTRPHFIGFYSIYLGLQNRPWGAMVPGEKAALRKIFDRLVTDVRATSGAPSAIEAELNVLGVGTRRDRNR